MKLLKLEIFAALVLFGAVQAYAQQVNFSGKWKLDTTKSDFGKVPHFVIFNQAVIRQTKDSVNLTSVTSDRDGHDRPAETVAYALNGKPNQNTLEDTIKVVGSFGYAADGKTLLKKQTYTLAADPQKVLKVRQDSWSLSVDGQELTVKRELKSFNKKEVSFTIVAVYDKQ